MYLSSSSRKNKCPCYKKDRFCIVTSTRLFVLFHSVPMVPADDHHLTRSTSLQCSVSILLIICRLDTHARQCMWVGQGKLFALSSLRSLDGANFVNNMVAQQAKTTWKDVAETRKVYGGWWSWDIWDFFLLFFCLGHLSFWWGTVRFVKFRTLECEKSFPPS